MVGVKYTDCYFNSFATIDGWLFAFFALWQTLFEQVCHSDTNIQTKKIEMTFEFEFHTKFYLFHLLFDIAYISNGMYTETHTQLLSHNFSVSKKKNANFDIDVFNECFLTPDRQWFAAFHCIIWVYFFESWFFLGIFFLYNFSLFWTFF